MDTEHICIGYIRESTKTSQFNMFLHVLYCLLWMVGKVPPFFQPMEAKPKPIVTCSHPFSHARCWLHVFASNSDWSIVLLWLVTVIAFVLVYHTRSTQLFHKASLINFFSIINDHLLKLKLLFIKLTVCVSDRSFAVPSPVPCKLFRLLTDLVLNFNNFWLLSSILH